MHYVLEDVELISGFTTQSCKAGETIEVLSKAFLTPSNSTMFYKSLEGLEAFLTQYLSQFAHSTISNFLILIDKKTKKAQVYINEVGIIAKVVAKRNIEKGEGVSKNDIAGISGIELIDIEIPPDNAIVFYFSIRWKKGLYFDFSPICSNNKLINIKKELGDAYQSVLFDEFQLLDSTDNKYFYENGWFPFIALLGDLFEGLIFAKKSNSPLTVAENKIYEHFSDGITLKSFLEKYKKNEIMQQHIPFIEAGIERFLEKDYISCISNIWLRIEGIMRYLYLGKGSPGQGTLLSNIVDMLNHEQVVPLIYFPNEFKEYMKTYYFKNFNLENNEIQLSRHTLGHGVSDVNSYDKKRAVIGFLIIDQLFSYIKMNETINGDICDK